jgi:REP element-mobilizing transposase RayT
LAHSFPNVIVHCVFGTKERRNIIPAELQPKLWKYFGGIGRNHDVPVLTAGGTANHAHVLLALPATITLSTAVQVLKANSSRWIGEHGIRFAWQEGYGAFSVGAPNVRAVKAYIANQLKHHAKRTFEQEFITMLEKAGVPYNPKYVFG